ncbi:MAG: hypothetical protein EXQ52_14430 [Bryobacterales bacterium]|nr:hypothetical protein [Bryobacterales bacterium]
MRLRLLVPLACALQLPASFRASVVKIDITPDTPQYLRGYQERKSEGIHDRIYHRIAGMDDGKTQFFLVSSDLCVASPSFYDEMAIELEKAGVPRGRMWWALTHTHSAPEVWPPGLSLVIMPERYRHAPDLAYTARVKQSLISGVLEARAKLAPARLGVGWGFSMANMNRRARDVEGPVRLGLNPEGPVDRSIGMIRIEKADGSPLALIANYAMHGTALGGRNLLISGDAQGIVAEYVESKLHAPMLYINGAAGNIAPLYGGAADFKSGITQFRVLLGDKIVEASRRIAALTDEVSFQTGSNVIETPRKAGLGWVEPLKDFLRIPAGGPALIRVPVSYLRINGDTLLWAAPLELFCEIALQVRSQSPYPFTFFFGYSNGVLGYLPAKSEFPGQGYEINVTPFTDQAESDFTQGVVAHIRGMAR